MEQDIWFHEKIEPDPLPDPRVIRSHLHLHLHIDYHAVKIDDHLYHPRLWEGSTLIHGPLVRRAAEFGIDFSAHPNWFINRDSEYWNRRAGGRLSLGQHDAGDTMDEFGLYCAVVEKTTAGYCPRAVHLQGTESLRRFRPEFYNSYKDERLRVVADEWNSYCSVYHAIILASRVKPYREGNGPSASSQWPVGIRR